jgi:heme a synthase
MLLGTLWRRLLLPYLQRVLTPRRFARFAWGFLAYNLAVILWGAWVRISGSGAGCGEHWPMCNGEVIPRSPTIETLIELSHRVTSGISVILVLGLVVGAFVAFPKKHRVRKGALGGAAFLFLEALFGAALVLLGLTGTDQSGLRALFISLHLVNTFALTGFLALTAFWASGGAALRRTRELPWLLGGVAAVLLTSVAGAITALGDTLFPVDTHDPRGLLTRVGSEISAGANFLIRLRVVHPVVAVLSALYLWLLSARWREDDKNLQAQRWAWRVSALVLVQLVAGGLNVALAAPGWMQLVHLLLASFVWISLLLLMASAVASRETPGDR